MMDVAYLPPYIQVVSQQEQDVRHFKLFSFLPLPPLFTSLVGGKRLEKSCMIKKHFNRV